VWIGHYSIAKLTIQGGSVEDHYYFLDSFVKRWPILIIFGMQQRKTILNDVATLFCKMQKS